MASLTPDARKIGTGTTPSPMPFYTPRPERRRPDSRGHDWNLNRQDRDKEANVQVLLRCRPLSDDELRVNIPSVITCNESRREVGVSQSVASKHLDRVFTFDKVFGPKAQQRTIYDQAIAPLVSEVLEGFNCTVFAYGQTGTGKTYTMEGGMRNKGGELPAEAGIIPRAVRQIFDTLEAQKADYSMKVTFSELYNEEIIDLLATEDQLKSSEERQKKNISLMEDAKGSVIVRGLEEEAVYSANDIYTLLERGASRRRMADTLLNKRSSRSHSIFSVTVHIKEGTIGEEELIKCGKLNLVDLAGSENINRSGARESRAREAGEINKSLLTLGRVITSLVEHSVHIPYRDSKLTRLLRDSLGGKTKTCIIATISPSSHCLEETLSTLDYAHRAKSIKNKPEANQKISKTVLLKDMYMELERMKQDIRAAREKNGVYIPHERFLHEEAEKKAKNERIEQLEIDLRESEKQREENHEFYLREQNERLNVESELKNCKINLESINRALQDLQENYNIALSELKEKESIISKLQNSENTLIDCAKKLRVDLQDASEDISLLFGKLDHKDKLERENQKILLVFGAQFDESLKELQKIVLNSTSQHELHLRTIEEHNNSFFAHKCESNKAMEEKVKKLYETYTTGALNLDKLINTMQMKTSSDLEEMKSMFKVQATAVENFLKTAVSEATEIVSDIQKSLDEERDLLVFSYQQQAEGLNQTVVSAEVLSQAAMNFSDDLYKRATELVKIIEENQIKKSLQFQNFEKMFKEEAIREEQLAMEKIAAIFSSLTSRKINTVCEATKHFEESNIQENKKLMVDLSKMQQVLTSEMDELKGYVEKVKDHYVEGVFSLTERRDMMEHFLKDCAEKVNWSSQHWQNAKSDVISLVKTGLCDVESAVRTKNLESESLQDNLVSSLSLLGAELDSHQNELLMSLKNSLFLDSKNEKEISAITTTSADQLNITKDNYNIGISDVRNRSEQFIHRDYLVDQKADETPKKRAISVPSLDSIEKMRAVIHDDDDSENNLKWDKMKPRIMQAQLRTPFQAVNATNNV